jgi:hypothetical protein
MQHDMSMQSLCVEEENRKKASEQRSDHSINSRFALLLSLCSYFIRKKEGFPFLFLRICLQEKRRQSGKNKSQVERGKEIELP